MTLASWPTPRAKVSIVSMLHGCSCVLLRVSCMEVCYIASTRTMNNARTAAVHAIFHSALFRRSAGRFARFAHKIVHVWTGTSCPGDSDLSHHAWTSSHRRA